MRCHQCVRASADTNSSIPHLLPVAIEGGAASGPNATASRTARFGGGREAERSGGGKRHKQFKAGHNVQDNRRQERAARMPSG
jgi:hypothetical protein